MNKHIRKILIKYIRENSDFPGSAVVKSFPSNAGDEVQLLVGELKLYTPWDEKNGKNIKQKQYCNKFNKVFKNGPHKKKNLRKYM